MKNQELVYTITGTSPAGAAATAVIGSVVDFSMLPGTTQQSGLEVVDDLDVIAVIQGGTGGTLDLYLQTSPDNVTFTDYAHFTQLAAGATQTTVSFSIARAAQALTITTVGQGLSPALAANTVTGGPIARFIRLVGKTGAGNTAGMTQTLTLVAHGPTRTR